MTKRIAPAREAQETGKAAQAGRNGVAEPSNPGAEPSNPGAEPSNPGAEPSNPGAEVSNPGAEASNPAVEARNGAAGRRGAPAPVAGTGGRDPALGEENRARAALVDACLRMTALGLNAARAGNVSLRWHRGGARGDGMLVTPSAMPCVSMTVDDIVWLPLDADKEKIALHRPRPSSEWRLHRDVYLARAEPGAVVHTHSPAASALACLPAVQAHGIPAFHYMVAVAGGADIRCAPYRTFGTADLSQAALAALVDRRACLLANHGAVALGATLDAALEMAVEVESLAAMYARALQLGEPVVLPADEVARVLERFRAYRSGG